MKEKKWRIELTEHQLRLMAQCIEDATGLSSLIRRDDA